MAVVKGTNPPSWGIISDVASLMTQRVSSTQRSDKKEARDKIGDVKAVAYYNNHTEINVEGLGTVSTNLAAALTVADIPTAGGSIFTEEITTERVNEEFVKTSIRGYAYAGIA